MKKLLLTPLLSVSLFCQAQTLNIGGFTKLDVNLLAVPSVGTVVPTSDGGYFWARGLKLTKYDANNAESWSTSLSGSSRIGYSHAITAICEDGQGGAIITGKVHGTLTAGNDSITPLYTATGMGFYSADAFIARVNATGKVWWHRLGEYDQTSPDEDKGVGVLIKGDKVYWLAHAKGRNLRFGTTSYPMAQYGNNVGVLAQFMMDGTPDWINLTKGGGVVPIFLAAGNTDVFYNGYSLGSSTAIDFGNNIKITYNQASFFAVKFSQSGTADWAKTYDDDNMLQNNYGFTTDDEGNVYACGMGSNFSSSYGIKKGQGYLLKMSGSDGSHQWTRSLSKITGASNLLHGPLLGVQFVNGKIYVGGNTNGDLYLESSANDSVSLKLSSNLLAAEQFIAQYDKAGTLTAHTKAVGGSAGGTISFLQNSSNKLIAAGTFSTNLAFGSHTMPSTGGNVGVYFIGFYTVETGGGSSGLTDKTDGQQALQLYPNPTNGKVQVLQNINPNAQVLLFDLAGKLILNQPLLTTEIDLSALGKGMYYIRIVEGNNTYTLKLIKE